MTINELCEKRNQAWQAGYAFVETKRDKDGLLSDEDAKTYAQISKPTSTPITEKPMNGKFNSGKGKSRCSTDEYVSNFWDVMRNKAPLLQVVNALQVSDDAERGYLVPDEYEQHLVEALEEENILRKLAHTVQTDSGERKIPVVASKGTANWIDE